MTKMLYKGLQPPPQGQPPWYPGANAGVTFGADPPPNPIRGHFWWDGNLLWIFDGINWVTDGFSKALFQEMTAADPSLITLPIVADGTPANFNQVGYIWTATADGSWTQSATGSTPPPANLVLASAPLPAGDWNVSYKLTLQASATSSAGVGAALFRLSTPLPPGALNNMSSYAVNIPTQTPPAGDGTIYQPLVINGPTTPINLAAQTGLVFNLYIWASGVIAAAPYHLDLWARRVR